MSQWHRNHPELVGTDADPWMEHAAYRALVEPPLPEDDDLDSDASERNERHDG